MGISLGTYAPSFETGNLIKGYASATEEVSSE
jgi:hypothetical protein